MCQFCKGWGSRLGPEEPCIHCGRYMCTQCNGYGIDTIGDECPQCKGNMVLRIQPKITRVVCKQRARKLIKRGLEVKVSVTGYYYWTRLQ